MPSVPDRLLGTIVTTRWPGISINAAISISISAAIGLQLAGGEFQDAEFSCGAA